MMKSKGVRRKPILDIFLHFNPDVDVDIQRDFIKYARRVLDGPRRALFKTPKLWSDKFGLDGKISLKTVLKFIRDARSDIRGDWHLANGFLDLVADDFQEVYNVWPDLCLCCVTRYDHGGCFVVFYFDDYNRIKDGEGTLLLPRSELSVNVDNRDLKVCYCSHALDRIAERLMDGGVDYYSYLSYLVDSYCYDKMVGGYLPFWFCGDLWGAFPITAVGDRAVAKTFINRDMVIDVKWSRFEKPSGKTYKNPGRFRRVSDEKIKDLLGIEACNRYVRISGRGRIIVRS